MVQGLDQWDRRWRAIPERVRAEVATAMERQAKKIVKEMKAIVGKRSGALAASIAWTWGDAPKGAMVVGNVAKNRYAAMQITIYAGGTAGTKRRQRRASGTRRSDQNRSGYFEGDRADNAYYQEFGTSRMRANPFFFPVWRSRKKLVRSGLNAGVRRGLKSKG